VGDTNTCCTDQTHTHTHTHTMPLMWAQAPALQPRVRLRRRPPSSYGRPATTGNLVVAPVGTTGPASVPPSCARAPCRLLSSSNSTMTLPTNLDALLLGALLESLVDRFFKRISVLLVPSSAAPLAVDDDLIVLCLSHC